MIVLQFRNFIGLVFWGIGFWSPAERDLRFATIWSLVFGLLGVERVSSFYQNIVHLAVGIWHLAFRGKRLSDWWIGN